MGVFDQKSNEDANDRFDAERQRLENKLLDAANNLLTFMGCSACIVPSRVGSGTVVGIGTQDDLSRLLHTHRAADLTSTPST